MAEGAVSSIYKPKSLRVAAAIVANSALAAVLVAGTSQAVHAADSVASLIQTINTSEFSPASPDPAGIAYHRPSATLLVSDSEVNETALFTGDNLFEMDPSGVVLNSTTTIGFSDEPTGVAFNKNGRTLYVTDDVGRRVVYVVKAGPDDTYGTGDDRVTSFRTSVFGSTDPEGITFVPRRKGKFQSLYIVDGVTAEVYRIRPGKNRKFDGVDDRIRSFDTEALGVTDPEGIAYNRQTNHLYLVGRPSDTVFEVTLSGRLVQTIDISEADGANLAGLEIAPSSTDSKTLSMYIVDRGVDNNTDPTQNDGRIYEMTIPPPPGE